MTKEELLELISNKENQLSRAQVESNSWNKGKYKSSSKATVSKIFVSALEKEIKTLKVKLSESTS